MTREQPSTLRDLPQRILRLRVTLESMRAEVPTETVSCTIEIRDGDTLCDLHLAIQDAFGWDNDHLYAFYMNNRLFDRKQEYAGDPMGGDFEDRGFGVRGSPSETELREPGLRRGKHFKYRFDYGDELIHTVGVLDSNAPPVEGAGYPRVVERVGKAPPQYPVYEE